MSRVQYPGLLITLEGGEGGGKTTQSIRLRQKLAELGKEVVVLREPGGTAISEQIRQVTLSPDNLGMEFSTEVLLFQAARAQLYHEVVLPSLEAGKIVVMDRSLDSSVVYQGIVRGFGRKLIENLNNLSTDNTIPDLTILLDLPVDLGLKRRAGSGKMDRLDMEAKEFHQKVREAYLELAKEDKSGRWVVVDATGNLNQVEQDIWKEVEKKVSQDKSASQKILSLQIN